MQLGGRELSDPALSRADDLARKRPLAVQHLVHVLLERAHGNQLMHLYVPSLSDPEGSIGCLLLHGGIPPTIEVEYVVCPGEINPVPPARSERRKTIGPRPGLWKRCIRRSRM